MSRLNFSAIAVKQRSVTLFFLLLTLIGGLYAFLAMGRAEDPTFTVRVMMVSAQWPGASPEVIERQLVDPLEKEIQQVADLKTVETTIRPGAVYLKVEFEDFVTSAELPDRFYQVRRRMRDIEGSLPEGVIGPQINEDFSDVYFSLMALTSDNRSQRELLLVAEALRDRLQQVQGVNKAQMFGERQQRVFVQFDAAKLQRLGASAGELAEQLQQFNQLIPAGSIESEGPTLRIRLDNDLSDLSQLKTLPLVINQRQFQLQDVARVERGFRDPPQQLIRAFGEDALLLGVVMEQGENGQQFGERLATFVQQQKQRLPVDIQLRVLTNQANAIDDAVNLFQVKFFVALLVVMGVSILAIGFRAGLVVGIAIPVTLAATFMVMLAMGMNLDRITLGALIIALGLLVDDAIIAIEMMLVKMEEGIDRVQAATYAWTVTAAPMLFGTLVTVAGFVPIGFAKSAVGEYAGNIFWVLAISLILSWLVAVFFTPYLGVKMLPAIKEEQKSRSPAEKYPRLRQLISYCVGHKKTVVFATFALLIVAIVGLVGPVEKQFFPASDRTEVIVSVYMPEGTAFHRTNKTMQQLEKIAADADGIESVSAYIGAGPPRYFISANPEQPNSAFAKLLVVTKNPAARDQLMQTFNQAIDDGEFTQARIRVERLLYGPPVEWPVAFRVMGPDPVKLRQIAGQVREVMAANQYTLEPHLEWSERVPVVQLQWQSGELIRHGFTPALVAQQLNMLLDGQRITQLRDGIRTVPLEAISDQVALDHSEAAARYKNVLQQIELRNQQGRVVPLTQLADITVGFEDPVLKRYNREFSIAVNSEIAGAQPKDVTDAIWQQLQPIKEQLPFTYDIQIAGTEEQSAKAQASIQALQPLMLALMLIFVMLQMRSFSGTFMVIMTAPLGLIGAVAALLIFRQPFGFVATLGLIGLAGILMRNTLILTQQVSDNLNEGMAERKAIIEAAVQRARPVLLTAFAAVLAFVPLTLDSFWGPLAYVLIGGISVGTIITLLFVPALYALWYRT
ncbi:efflux RND transporter permease subunit [Idiomarina seosinensis]|uniref:efflux RND transporter permease subunit n=1 Tax=Idiomarina seosinensis TaxID=281739 RepID=UPI00384EDA09